MDSSEVVLFLYEPEIKYFAFICRQLSLWLCQLCPRRDTFNFFKGHPLLMHAKLVLISHTTSVYNDMSGGWIRVSFAESTLAHPHC